MSDGSTVKAPLEVIEAVYAAMAARDLDTYLAFCHPEIQLYQDPAVPYGGRRSGHEGVVELGIALLGTIDSKVTTLAMFEAGDQVVQYGRTAGTVLANGAPFDIPETHVWTVVDGLVTAVTFYIDSAALLAAIAEG